MSLILQKVLDVHYALEDMRDPRVDGYFLMSSIWTILGVVAVYIFLVKYLGPKLMEKRKPFKIDQILIYYNIIQIIYCGYMILMASVHLLPYYNIFCEPCDYSSSFRSNMASQLCYAYFLLKFVDLCDTIFFVLKKNSRQISFLHVYHHSAMLIMAWISVKFAPGGSGVYMGFTNCAVHVLMYGYYLFCVIYGTSKLTWIKKHITHVQFVQFAFDLLIFSSAMLRRDCAYPFWLASLGVGQSLIMFYIFGDFYYNTYLKDSKKIK